MRRRTADSVLRVTPPTLVGDRRIAPIYVIDGVRLNATDATSMLARLDSGMVFTLNPDHLYHLQRSPEFLAAYRTAVDLFPGGATTVFEPLMRELGYDRSLADIAMQVNDSQGRLEYIATLTEQAANGWPDQQTHTECSAEQPKHARAFLVARDVGQVGASRADIRDTTGGTGGRRSPGRSRPWPARRP